MVAILQICIVPEQAIPGSLMSQCTQRGYFLFGEKKSYSLMTSINNCFMTHKIKNMQKQTLILNKNWDKEYKIEG